MAANHRAIHVSSAFTPVIRMAVLAGFLATLSWAFFQALDGRLEVGSFGCPCFLTQRLLWPMTRIAQTFDLYQRGMASGVVFSISSINRSRSNLARSTYHRNTLSSCEIRFNGVGFSYETRANVLNGNQLCHQTRDHGCPRWSHGFWQKHD